jgi:hypothetical protein
LFYDDGCSPWRSVATLARRYRDLLLSVAKLSRVA